MKIYLSLIVLFVGAFMFLNAFKFKETISSYHEVVDPLNSGGAPSGKTGAPSENTCTSCHSGAIQDGNNGENVLELVAGGTEYVPDALNAMKLTFNNAATKNGFQLTVLNAVNNMAGTFNITDASNTKLVSNAILLRDYVTHTSNGTTKSSWTFDWLAPIEGGDVTFYVATNKTNANAANSGDVVYVSEHVFSSLNQVGLESATSYENPDFKVGFDLATGSIVADYEITYLSNLSINLVDLKGASVYFENIGMHVPGAYHKDFQIENLESGIYVVTLFENNKPHSTKLFIP